MNNSKSNKIFAKLLLLLLITAGISSCNVIDQVPESDLADGNFWQTPNDAENALTGVYNSLQNVTTSIISFIDLRADDVVLPAELGWSVNVDIDIRQNQITASSLNLGHWDLCYNGIGRVNKLISKIPQIQFNDQSQKNRILGEAYFLRALFYFYLVRDWGDVPIITDPITTIDNTALVRRNSEKEVYNQIVLDCSLAEKLMPDVASIGKIEHIRATKYASKALLCNIYLERAYKSYAEAKDFENAARLAQEIIDSNKYKLVAGSIYKTIFEKEYSSESILEVDYNYINSETNGFINYFYPRAYTKKKEYGGGALRCPSPKITTDFENGDLRTPVNFQIVPTPDGGYYDKEFAGMPYVTKYPGTVITEGVLRYSDSNFILYRLSDIILMRAEALVKMNNISQSLDLVNLIRNRAGLSNLEINTKDQVIRAIQKERLYELCFEGKRWYDLVRTGLLFEIIPNFSPKERIYLPVPQDEIDKNPNLLPQNPTY